MEAFQAFTRRTGLKSNLRKSQIVFGGDYHQVHRECLSITGFAKGQPPLRYLGMPSTSSKLSKLECRTLVEKISGMITTWPSTHIYDAGRVVLINTVLFGMFNYWPQIFILPKEVVDPNYKIVQELLREGRQDIQRFHMLVGKGYAALKIKEG